MARNLKKKGGPIATGKFSVEESRSFIIAMLICFHIFPLLFIFMGQVGQDILQVVNLSANPLFIFCICFFRAFKLGFSFKFPLLTGVISGLSILMYHNYYLEAQLLYAVVYLIAYFVLSLICEIFGGFLKKMIGG